MSQFSVPVIKIEKVEKHPNADSLSITEADGCPVIFKTGQFKDGDLAVYVPVEAVVPTSHPDFAFLATKEGQTTHRIKAKKLRGVFSMGLLLPFVPGNTIDADGKPVPEGAWLGQDMAAQYGIVKYEEPVRSDNMRLGGQRLAKAKDTWVPVYDIESHRKYRMVYEPGEEVVATEKIHGCNGRFIFTQRDGDEAPRLYVGSHNFFLKEDDKAVWWATAKKHGLAEKLAKYPDLVLYGEVYGQVQDLKYGTTQEDPLRFAAFDLFDRNAGRYLDYDRFRGICAELDIPVVPVIYRGPFDPAVIEPLALGNSVIADQIKEGVVIKPVIERQDRRLGRVITKLVGEQYLLRKGGTEHQ